MWKNTVSWTDHRWKYGECPFMLDT